MANFVQGMLWDEPAEGFIAKELAPGTKILRTLNVSVGLTERVAELLRGLKPPNAARAPKCWRRQR